MNSERQALLQSIGRSAETIGALSDQVDRLQAICSVILEALRGGNKILTAGHGGSAADALHMAEELVGRFKANRSPLPALALVGDPTLLTCISNDFGFEHIFPRQVESLGQPGDVLVIFTTSGNGDGFLMAVEAARKKMLTSVALIGKDGGALAGKADVELIVGDHETARIQEAHTVILHLILEAVERAFVETP